MAQDSVSHIRRESALAPRCSLSYYLRFLILKSFKPSMFPYYVCRLCTHLALAPKAPLTLIYPPGTQAMLQLNGGSLVP